MKSKIGRRKRRSASLLLTICIALMLAAAALIGYMYLNPSRWPSINPFRPEVAPDYSVVENWDLVVYGSEPEAISAAVVAARQGLKTLLVSPDPELGGLMTLGWLNSLDMCYDISDGSRRLLSGGFFEEWWDELERPHSFPINEALRAFQRFTAAEANLTVRLNNQLISVELLPLEPPVATTTALANAAMISASTSTSAAPATATSATAATSAHELDGTETIQVVEYTDIISGDVRKAKNSEELLQRVKFVSYAEEFYGLEYRVQAPFYIDASPDGDLMACTSAPYTVGWQDVGRPGVMMAPTLVFEVDGVNWSEVMRYVNELEDPRFGVNDDSAWAYWEIAARYRATDPQVYLRGLNIGRQNPREAWDQANVLINALLIFDVDVLDPVSRAEAIRRGEEEARLIVDFLRREAPGFAAAEFVRTAPKLYIRESRHLIGTYTLTLGDVITERNFWDEIAIGAYPVDLQAVSISERERTVYTPTRGYGVPLRSLIPQSGPQNLLVVGRAAGFTSEAHGSARVIPLGMCTAEAAALTVVEANRSSNTNLRTLVAQPDLVQRIQEAIRLNGGIIRPVEPHEMLIN